MAKHHPETGRTTVMVNLYSRHKGKCYYCGVHTVLDKLPSAEQPENYATRDHIVAKAHGGLNMANNKVLACKKCNGERGDMPFSEFKSKMGVIHV